jgi:hypothetical protein
VRLDLANGCQAKDLKSAAVREDGGGPANEGVQPAGSADDFQSRSDPQVISISENDLGRHFAQLAWVDGLDAALSAYRHEHRRIDHTMRCGQAPQTRFRRFISFYQLKHLKKGSASLRRLPQKDLCHNAENDWCSDERSL